MPSSSASDTINPNGERRGAGATMTSTSTVEVSLSGFGSVPHGPRMPMVAVFVWVPGLAPDSTVTSIEIVPLAGIGIGEHWFGAPSAKSQITDWPSTAIMHHMLGIVLVTFVAMKPGGRVSMTCVVG